MIHLTRRVVDEPAAAPPMLVLRLTAEERTRSRSQQRTDSGETLALQLPRGTVLNDGDVLLSDDSVTRVLIRASAEPVLTARTADTLLLLRAAYHLGNRHVPLEVSNGMLRLSPDPVLADMLRRMGIEVIEEHVPFHPEPGAYAGGHASHPHVFRDTASAHD
jgi:urease accessory protein